MDNPDDTRRVPIVASKDPNDIIGPAGYGPAQWVSGKRALDYTIRYENDATWATAPAQRVVIEQTLDPDLDPRSFRVGAFGFGGRVYEAPANRAAYTARLDISETLGVWVDVQAGIDIVTGQARWVFQAIDPATGQAPTNPLVGFLPPNLNGSEGEGFVSYTVMPKRTVQTGATVQAQARIVFDANDPIDTPSIFHTLDVDDPAATMHALPPRQPSGDVVVTWDAADGAGSGVGGVDVQVSVDGGPFAVWQSGITETTAIYAGEAGHVYGFFARAVDNAANAEGLGTSAEAITLVYAPGAPASVSVDVEPLTIKAGGMSTITAVVRDAGSDLVSGVVVTFTSSTGSLTPDSGVTGDDGTVTSTLTSVGVGTVNITATAASLSGGVNGWAALVVEAYRYYLPVVVR